MLHAQWPAAGYEHIFNAGGENRLKFIFTLSTATVNMSSGQILRHYDNRSNINTLRTGDVDLRF